MTPLQLRLLALSQTALYRFQMIEEGLKCYIGIAYGLIQEAIQPELSFKWSANEIHRASLERLMTMYSRVARNTTHLDQLRKLVDTRNYVAHRAFADVYINPSVIEAEGEARLKAFEAANLDAQNCLDQLGEELKLLRATCVKRPAEYVTQAGTAREV